MGKFKIEKLGYTFEVEASCAGEALQILKKQNPDHVVFIDSINGNPVGFTITGNEPVEMVVSGYSELKFGDVVGVNVSNNNEPFTYYIGFTGDKHIGWDRIYNRLVELKIENIIRL